VTYSLKVPQVTKIHRQTNLVPEGLDRLAAFVHQRLDETGHVPTVGDMGDFLGCSYAKASLAWRALVATGKVSADLVAQREREKYKNSQCSNDHHSGRCTPETATKLYNLLKNDVEARISFFELLRGKIRKAYPA